MKITKNTIAIGKLYKCKSMTSHKIYNLNPQEFYNENDPWGEQWVGLSNWIMECNKKKYFYEHFLKNNEVFLVLNNYKHDIRCATSYINTGHNTNDMKYLLLRILRNEMTGWVWIMPDQIDDLNII